jgi:hypothetical protein
MSRKFLDGTGGQRMYSPEEADSARDSRRIARQQCLCACELDAVEHGERRIRRWGFAAGLGVVGLCIAGALVVTSLTNGSGAACTSTTSTTSTAAGQQAGAATRPQTVDSIRQGIDKGRPAPGADGGSLTAATRNCPWTAR